MDRPERRFQFQLCLSLHERHPDHLIGVCDKDDPLTPRQLNEWIAFHNLFPFGEIRADLRSGLERLTMAQVQGIQDCTLDRFILPECLGETPRGKPRTPPEVLKQRMEDARIEHEAHVANLKARGR